MKFESLVRAGHLRRSDHHEFFRLVTSLEWRRHQLGYLDHLMRLRSGGDLFAEHFSHGVMLRIRRKDGRFTPRQRPWRSVVFVSPAEVRRVG
jgi:hypothetical protein